MPLQRVNVASLPCLLFVCSAMSFQQEGSLRSIKRQKDIGDNFKNLPLTYFYTAFKR